MKELNETPDDNQGFWTRCFFASILVMLGVMVDVAAFNPLGTERTVAYMLAAFSFGACFFAAYKLRRHTERRDAASDAWWPINTCTDNALLDVDSCDADSSGGDCGGDSGGGDSGGGGD